MDGLAKEYVIDFFSKKLMLFGNAPAAVGWSSIGQRQRYECITKLINLENSGILDFGCGKGDFYSFLKEKGIMVKKYTGTDINKNLIETAARNYPETEFLTLDMDSEEIPGSFDYIILCGVFNLNIKGVKESIEIYLKKIFLHANKTLLFNCLSSLSEYKDPFLVYLNPSELMSTALTITKSVSMHHNLIEGDIFLLLNR